MKDKLSKLLDLSRRVGYLYPSFQIYSGMKGSYDYGPLGSKLKRNILNSWLNFQSYNLPFNIYELDTSILTKPSVLKASGHIDNFTDDLTDCLLTKGRFRKDKLDVLKLSKFKGYDVIKVKWEGEAELDRLKKELEVLLPNLIYLVNDKFIVLFIDKVFDINIESDITFKQPPTELAITPTDNPDLKLNYKYLGYASPANSPFMTTSRPFNLMLKTFIDSIEPIDSTINHTLKLLKNTANIEDKELTDTVKESLNNSTAYLRPETCQGIFVNYQNLLTHNRLKLPFGALQVGKSFRNEISCEHLVFRTLEFEQMELELFTPADQAAKHFETLVELRYRWWTTLLNHKQNLRKYEQPKSDLAHYAERCTDLEFKFPWGWGELEGIANRTNYDLIQHAKATDKEFVEDTHGSDLPYVIETSAGLNRAFLTVLLDALDTEREENGSERLVLRIKPNLAPIKVAIIPLVDNDQFNQIARQLELEFKKNKIDVTLIDSKLKVGKKYYRMDSIGTPYCLTIDSQSVESNQVTVRFRDTKIQETVDISNVVGWVKSKLEQCDEV